MTLHLSLLHLPRSRAEWCNLEIYQAHQVAWRAFPDIPREKGSRPFLFSLDTHAAHHGLLVQSTIQPNWNFLNGGATARTKTFDPAATPAGTELRYFLRANPTVNRRYADGETRRVGIGLNRALQAERMGLREQEVGTREDQLIDWLGRRGEEGGFAVETCLPGPTVARRIWRSTRPARGERPMTLHEVELTGRLRVTDPSAFADTCAKGIGRGKAFGCGLLMVRPAD